MDVRLSRVTVGAQSEGYPNNSKVHWFETICYCESVSFEINWKSVCLQTGVGNDFFPGGVQGVLDPRAQGVSGGGFRDPKIDQNSKISLF